jgi:hypothetical protein
MKVSNSATSLTSLVPDETGGLCIICLDDKDILSCCGTSSCACSYFYHETCIGEWVKKHPHQCPMCRKFFVITRSDGEIPNETIQFRIIKLIFCIIVVVAGLSVGGLIIWKLSVDD